MTSVPVLPAAHVGARPARVLSSLLALALAAVVLAFGGTEPATLAVVQSTLLLATAVLLLWGHPLLTTVPLRRLTVPAILVGFVVLQVLPLPFAGRPGATLSVDIHETTTRLVHLLACVCAFYLALAVARRPNGGVPVLVYGLAALGLFEAVYGLVQYLTGWQQIFFYVKKYSLDAASGTYINRNHYAGLLEMVFPFCLALACYYFTRRRGHGSATGSRGRGRWLDATDTPRGVLWLFIAGVLLLALLFSRSRMGIVAALVAAVVMLGLLRASGRRSAALLPVWLLAVGVALAVWIGPGPVIERFEQIEEHATGTDSRLGIWRDTAQLIERHPWLGTGLGTFPIAYTSVQTAFLGRFVNSAHNDYLEFASDLGVPAALLLFGAVVWVLGQNARRFLAASGDGFMRSLALACAGSLVAILVHSLTDFNLQIPANALVFAVVLGLGCATSEGTAAGSEATD